MKPRPVTLEDICIAMAQLAAIIERSPHGEKYWPIFERLEREKEARESRSHRLAAAKAAAADLVSSTQTKRTEAQF